jgi:myo-inositol-1(or 4)-monophosphatase
MPGSPSPDPLLVAEMAARAGGRVLQAWRGRFAVRQKGPRDLVTEADVAAQEEIRRIVLDAFPAHGFVGEEVEAGVPRPTSGQPGHAGEGLRWLVDPLDGTSNYVHDFPAWCVSVALADGDNLLAGAIFDPVHDECFTAAAGRGAWLNGRPIHVAEVTEPAEALMAASFPPHVSADTPAVRDFLAVLPHVHSVRRTGSTALNLAWLACGRLHGFWVRRIACWDVAAGILLVREAGGTIEPFATTAGGPTGVAGPIPLDAPGLLAASTPTLLAAVRRCLGPAE